MGESKLGVCVTTRDGKILFRDTTFTALLGDGGCCCTSLGLSDELKSDTAQTVIVNRDGRSLSCRITPVQNPDGTSQCICIVQDLSDSQHTQQRLEESLSLLSSLVDACPVAILTLNRDQKITLWNPEAENTFGWSKEEVVGKGYPLVPEGERDDFEELFRRVVVDGEGFTDVEVQRQRKDGSYVLLNVSTAPLRDSDGTITGALALLADLTQQRALEDQVRHAQKMEAVGRLAGGVAHDFNNLLTVMLANSQLLSRQLSGQQDVLKSTNAIQHCAERARDLIQQLLTFSRRQVVNPRLLDVSGLARNTARMLRRTLGDAYSVHTDLAADLSPVRADEGQVEQVLLNLVVNARDAMARGGQITVGTCAVVRAGPVPASRPSAFICLSVADTGAGIDADALPHIFEPFFTTKRAGEGTGLGLATVYGIVTRNGGTIEVDSTPGKGTTFRVLLPVAEGSMVQRDIEDLQPDNPQPTSEGNVLVVEDEPLVLEAVAALIRDLGYTVTPVQTGREALSLIESGRPFDVVLTDVYMPEMTGRVFADLLRDQQPSMPVVFMSGNLSDDELRAQVEAGEATFLPKPLDTDDLAAALHELASHK